jgi:hypothetical protein
VETARGISITLSVGWLRRRAEGAPRADGLLGIVASAGPTVVTVHRGVSP